MIDSEASPLRTVDGDVLGERQSPSRPGDSGRAWYLPASCGSSLMAVALGQGGRGKGECVCGRFPLSLFSSTQPT